MNQKGLPFTVWDIRKQIQQAEKLGISLEELSKANGVSVEDLKLLKKLTPEKEGE